MARLLSIVAFIIAFLLNVFSISHGWFNYTALALLGLALFAISTWHDWWPAQRS